MDCKGETFCDNLVNERRTAGNVCLLLSKAVNTVSHNTLIDKFDEVWARWVGRELMTWIMRQSASLAGLQVIRNWENP